MSISVDLDSTDLIVGTIGSPEMLSGKPERRRALMAMVEASTIDHLFIADHISFHTGLGMDGIINAATLAAMSSRLQIFIGVYLLALRHPVPVARQLSSLSLSAPGRIILGVGIGGEDRHEMEICGVDPSKRGLQTNHCMAALKALMTGEPASYSCEFFEFEAAKILPAPSPAIPLIVGGRSDAAIRRAALYGDGWIGVWCSPARFGQVREQISTVAAENRETIPAWRHGLQVWTGFAASRRKAREIVASEMQQMYRLPFERFEKYSPYGSPVEVAEFLWPYVENGAAILNIKPCASSDEEEIAAVDEVKQLLLREMGTKIPS